MRKRGNQWPKNKIINIKNSFYTHFQFSFFLQTNKSFAENFFFCGNEKSLLERPGQIVFIDINTKTLKQTT